jgi:TolB-like protein
MSKLEELKAFAVVAFDSARAAKGIAMDAEEASDAAFWAYIAAKKEYEAELKKQEETR